MKKIKLEIFFILVSCVVTYVTPHSSFGFKSGADFLCLKPEKYLKGKRIGILSQQASIVKVHEKYEQLVDALYHLSKRKHASFKIQAIFAPEYGFYGNKEAGAFVAGDKHPIIGCPIYSLHGKVRTPQAEMLQDLDLIVIDLQDVGVRCYTYISTMVNTIEAACRANIPVLVLDRPNPIKNWGASDKYFDKNYRSFLAKIKIPFIHGMTIGDIAKKAAKKHKAKVHVISIRGNQQQALKYMSHFFVPPSPNLMSLQAVFCYPLTVALETTLYNEGRGTEKPFEMFGAPWVNGELLAKKLNEQHLPGIIFKPITFTPKASMRAKKPRFIEQRCEGVVIKFTDKNIVKPMLTAQTIISILFAQYPAYAQWRKTRKFHFVIDQMMAGPLWRIAIESKVKELQRVKA
ncbi:DUF1343 domain-containing protein [Candidatus Dependentiae bacterium]|nr:DUF1343 domain-containing protein [Candidatus Dependentiae bacterium]